MTIIQIFALCTISITLSSALPHSNDDWEEIQAIQVHGNGQYQEGVYADRFKADIGSYKAYKKGSPDWISSGMGFTSATTGSLEEMKKICDAMNGSDVSDDNCGAVVCFDASSKYTKCKAMQGTGKTPFVGTMTLSSPTKNYAYVYSAKYKTTGGHPKAGENVYPAVPCVAEQIMCQ